MYKRIDEIDREELIRITSSDRVFTGDEISPDYSHDELTGNSRFPELVVKVKSKEEIADIMKYANYKHIPVVVRGSGTGLVGGAVAIHGGILIDTLFMNRILELDEENLTVTVECGVLLMELAAFAEEHKFLYPPDPGEKTATIGGNISTNAGGMRAVKYGVTRDYIRGLTIVLPSGEIIQTGGKVVKNSTGYSLKDLIIGSEGTLGIVTEAVLKLIPLPVITVSLLAAFKSVREAVEAVPVLIKSRISLTAIEFMERETLFYAEEYLGKKFPNTNAPAYLLLTLDGNDREIIEKQLADTADLLCSECNVMDSYYVDTQERKDVVWTARGAFLEAIKASAIEMDECDVVVPRNAIAEFVLFTHEVAKKLNIRIPSFGHAGDGNLHIYICRDSLEQSIWEEKLKKAFSMLYKKARK